MSAVDRVARLSRDPDWHAVCERQAAKGMAKWGRSVDDYPGSASYWATHGAEEAVDGAVYSLRLSDTGHPIRGRLAAFLFALAARLLLPIR